MNDQDQYPRRLILKSGSVAGLSAFVAGCSDENNEGESTPATPTETETPDSPDSTDDTTTDEIADEEDPANFVVTIVETNEPISEGAEFVASVQIHNEGDMDGRQSVSLRVDDIEQASEIVTLSADQNEELDLVWQTQRGGSGTFNIEVASEDDSDSIEISVEKLETTGAGWPVYQFDKQNTGFGSTVTAPRSGLEIEWQFTSFDEIRSGAVANDGIVYIGSWDNFLYALDTETGQKEWEFETDRNIRSSPAIGDSSIFVSSDKVYSLNKTDGTQQWETDIPALGRGAPTLVDGTLYVPRQGELYALDASTGNIQWSFETDGGIYSSAAITNDTVFVGSRDNYLYALNAENGELVWDKNTRSDIQGAPVVWEETVFVANSGGAVYALSTETGDEKWRFGPVGDRFHTSPIVDGEQVYFGSVDRSFFAVSIDDGEEQWSKEFHTNAPPIIIDDIVYTTDGRSLLVVDSDTGTIIEEVETDGGALQSPAVYEGRLFAGDYRNNFYAFS